MVTVLKSHLLMNNLEFIAEIYPEIDFLYSFSFLQQSPIYCRLPEWGYGHKTVDHGAGEYARDEDGDGFHEVHVNTMEGFWSLLRSWLRPHRGISQEKLPIYLGFFEFVHNVRKRGKALLGSLFHLLVA